MVGIDEALGLYFKAYREHRIDDILDWFLLPGLFVSDGEPVALTPLATRAECRVGVQRVLSWHRQIGAARSHVVRQTVMELSPRLSCVHAAVEVQDGDGARLYDFESIYTFVRSGETWRISSAVFNQIPRLLACLQAQRGA